MHPPGTATTCPISTEWIRSLFLFIIELIVDNERRPTITQNLRSVVAHSVVAIQGILWQEAFLFPSLGGDVPGADWISLYRESSGTDHFLSVLTFRGRGILRSAFETGSTRQSAPANNVCLHTKPRQHMKASQFPSSIFKLAAICSTAVSHMVRRILIGICQASQ